MSDIIFKRVKQFKFICQGKNNKTLIFVQFYLKKLDKNKKTVYNANGMI